VFHRIKNHLNPLALFQLTRRLQRQHLPGGNLRHQQLRVVARVLQLLGELASKVVPLHKWLSDERFDQLSDDLRSPHASARSENGIEMP
jgi:hypothetical protein